jgi:putative endonuclease
MQPKKPWYLYLIECVDGSIYTGITVDVDARYQAHQDGRGARYTRSHRPVRLLGTEIHPDRSSASKAEYRVKQLSATEKRRLAQALRQPPD